MKLLNIFKFWSEKEQPIVEGSLVGRTFKLKTDNPFSNTSVKVHEEKQGWVRYNFIYDGKESRSGFIHALRKDDFMTLYEEVR